MTEQNETTIPIFIECTCCKRSFVNTSNMWADVDKRICSCCECFGYKDINQCRRTNCKLYKYIDHDFITDDPVCSIMEPEQDHSIIYDEKDNKCYCCGNELIEYFFINSKFSLFELGKYEDAAARAKLKAKICRRCFDKIFDKLKLNFEESDK
jgi:hypothetical protein